ncbi:ankyrin repeat domain-containing protein 34A [Protopterus annectens]|uniref:ankyrin repeat domain-containing protein 34A n=1 Tax=Protopterus annectens TaxID=7888 RepID=UPI001CFA5B99|nr:ankyrin repeat domain-containing protein 34A [Protopterus annectens]
MSETAALQTEGNTLLKAVWQGKHRLTRLLLEGGAYINEGNERGETPLMVACLASYNDPQSKCKLIKYLLENGADPNIPDKMGRTALMHACLSQAGVDTVTVLLEHGSDPSMKDYSGSSALVHAINKGDRKTLQVLLDACKAKGKEVIIITTDTSPSGTKKTKQYLNSPPSPGIDEKPSPGFCMSPSDIEIKTSPSPGADKEEAKDVFNFNVSTTRSGSSTFKSNLEPSSDQPTNPMKRLGNKKQLKRLNSEPWGLVAPSVLSASHLPAPPEKPEAEEPEEKLTSELNGLTISKRPLLSRRHSIEGQDSSFFKMMHQGYSEELSLLDSSWDDKVNSSSLHQPLSRRNTAPEAQESISHNLAPNFGNSLRNSGHHKLTRMDHYESDSHLCPDSIPGSPDSGRLSLERKKYNASPLTLPNSSSRESLESIPSAVSPITMRRRAPGLLERRGSGTLLLDHISHTRPGFLPPLNVNPNPPIPDIRSNGKPTSPVLGGHKAFIPVAPSSPKRLDAKAKKKLVRRHSMQPEQLKQLSHFQNSLVEDDSIH